MTKRQKRSGYVTDKTHKAVLAERDELLRQIAEMTREATLASERIRGLKMQIADAVDMKNERSRERDEARQELERARVDLESMTDKHRQMRERAATESAARSALLGAIADIAEGFARGAKE